MSLKKLIFGLLGIGRVRGSWLVGSLGLSDDACDGIGSFLRTDRAKLLQILKDRDYKQFTDQIIAIYASERTHLSFLGAVEVLWLNVQTVIPLFLDRMDHLPFFSSNEPLPAATRLFLESFDTSSEGLDLKNYLAVIVNRRANVALSRMNAVDALWTVTGSTILDFSSQYIPIPFPQSHSMPHSLRILKLSNTEVEFLNPLRTLFALERIYLSHTRVACLLPLQALTQLRYIDASSTRIRSIVAVGGLLRLRGLCFENTRVTDLSSVPGLSLLKGLHFANTRVASLEPVRLLTNLEALNLTGTLVDSLEPIEGLIKLEALDFSSTAVCSMDCVRGLVNLKRLGLSDTGVTSLEPVRELTRLEVVYMSRTDIGDFKPLRGLSLKVLGISRKAWKEIGRAQRSSLRSQIARVNIEG